MDKDSNELSLLLCSGLKTAEMAALQYLRCLSHRQAPPTAPKWRTASQTLTFLIKIVNKAKHINKQKLYNRV